MNNERSIIRLTIIDLNPVELNYHPFMISLDKCNGWYNVVDLSIKICALSETKSINAEVFNMIIRIKNIGKVYFM